ncbi:unnamed protein product [Toxocara canis]|uniref:Galactosylgalactosylxylosylprotein 3-beta-glucuronosyltransferase n=1 Tax=Toxocara canis TaxID=6265 RepID=A0A183UFP3_TOXCA|nr:unnamed protein product [Toxocara canis]
MSSTQRQFGVKASVIAFIFMLHFISVVVYAPSKAEVELSTRFCSRSFQALRPSEFRAQPLIIVITPTRKSLTRLPDMTRLAQSLMLVRRLAWVVVESGAVIADPIERLLKRSKLPFCYFTEHSNNAHLKDWRWLGRDSGLKFVIYRFAQFSNRAVVYFADADGAYDIRLFESYIRNVNTLGVWALGLAGAELVVAPRVTQIGIVDGWLSETHSDLEWPLDASGFAINLKVLLRHNKYVKLYSYHRENISLVNCESPVQQCFLLRLGLTRNDAKPFGYNIMPRDVLAWQPITSFRLKEPTKVYSTYDYVIEYDPPKQGWQSNKAYNGTTLTRQKVLKHAV